MNRRSFFGFVAAAPIAVAMGIAAKPVFAQGGVVKSKAWMIGEHGTEMILPRDWIEERHGSMIFARDIHAATDRQQKEWLASQ